jgi:hypothetical protein
VPGIRSRRHVLGVVTFIGALTLGFANALAQPAAPTRLRGTIISPTGNVLVLATREGSTVSVTLAEPLMISALRRVALSEITPGTSIGAVAKPSADANLRAVAITVLPPGARITELQVAWDLAPGTSMNNGPVAAVVENSTGRELTLNTNGRSVKLQVTPETPLLMPKAAARTDLVPGAVVFINATRGPDGALSAARVTVGKDGVVPVI